MDSQPRIGVVGATGAVGSVTLALLAERGYDRVRAFPELAARLATRYTVVAARDGYRIHEKSDGP